MKPIVVVKLGTASITNSGGRLDESVIEDICYQLSVLASKYRLILVTSGAVGCGKPLLTNFTGTDAQRRVAASVGNPVLIQQYQKYLGTSGIFVAQALLERYHFSDRNTFLILRETFEEWWRQGFLPIVNENDVVSDVEIRFSDNDELSTLLAINFAAQKLLFGTSVDGVLDGEKLIKSIENFSGEIFSLAQGTSSLGLGGMISKLNCAKSATAMGSEVVIFNARKKGNLLLADAGKTGTVCPARACRISPHQRWIATGSIASGKVLIDLGAAQALRNRKSLLAVGILEVQKDFEKGELFEIFQEGVVESIGIARAKVSSSVFLREEPKKGQEIAHTDEIVIF